MPGGWTALGGPLFNTIRFMLLPRLLLIAALGLAAGAHAEAPKATAKAAAVPKGLGLKDGDRFIFIGDSITHQCLYTQYVEDFFHPLSRQEDRLPQCGYQRRPCAGRTGSVR